MTTKSTLAARPVAGQPDDAGKPARMKFTAASLEGLLKSGRLHRQKMIWDTEEKGLSVLISRGPKHQRQATVTFRVVYYLKDNPGRPRYMKLGRWPERSDIQAVRDEARLIRIDARAGIDPRKPKLTGKFPETVARFIEDHARENRTWPETKRIFDLYVVPEWANKNIEDVKKDDVTDLLTKIRRGKIESKGKYYGSPAVARATRAQLVTLFNWYEAKHTTGKDFRIPIPKLLKSDPLQGAPERDRVLDDREIRALWSACATMGAYGAAVKTALLTAQRFRKVGKMLRSDLKDRIRVQGHSENGRWIEDYDIGHVWDPTRDDDPKNKGVSIVPLSRLAREVIRTTPTPDVSRPADYVFTTNGRGPIKGWSKYKAGLDKKMLALLKADEPTVALKPWQHRDLRRTARTLMSRLEIPGEVAEHCLAHKPPRIERTYNRYGYMPQKRDAFEKLASHIQRIVSPDGATVVPLAARRRRAGRRP
jgi:hypothetical protein